MCLFTVDVEELPPLTPESSLAYSLKCIDSEPMKSFKKCSPPDRLRNIELDLSKLFHEQTTVIPNTDKQVTQSTP